MPLYSFVTEQGHILGVMFLLGVCLGVVYDLQGERHRKRKGNAGRFLLLDCGGVCYLARFKSGNRGDFTILSIFYRCIGNDFVLCYR